MRCGRVLVRSERVRSAAGRSFGLRGSAAGSRLLRPLSLTFGVLPRLPLLL